MHSINNGKKLKIIETVVTDQKEPWIISRIHKFQITQTFLAYGDWEKGSNLNS